MSLNLLNCDEYSKLVERCLISYGVQKEVWTRYSLIKRKSSLWLCPHHIELQDVDVDTIGLRFFSGERPPYKPRLTFFQVFSSHIDKGFVHLSDQETHKFLHRESIELNDIVKGYLGVLNRGRYIGVGLGNGKDKVLVSQVPKKIGAQLPKKLC
jgi:hypothetical protein